MTSRLQLPFPRVDFSRIFHDPVSLSTQLQARGVNQANMLVNELLNTRQEQLKLAKIEEELRRKRNLGEVVDRSALKLAKKNVEEIETKLQMLAQTLPNWTHPDTPVGDESKAHILRSSSLSSHATLQDVPTERSVVAVDHLSICEKHDLTDFKAGAKVSGSKFVFLKGRLAMLELALQNLALQRLIHQGFTPIATPDLVHGGFLEACGFHPRGANTQVYAIENSDLVLVGTSEIPLAASLMGNRLSEQVKLAGFGHCFRTEAGSTGLTSKGMYRLHQFTKVEMYCATPAKESDTMHWNMLDFVTTLCTDLGLEWRALDMPTLELGASAYRKFDVEVWMPGSKRWGEVASITNCTDYQSRRLDIKCHDGSFAHTLNGTACAVPRMLLALLEVHYDGKNDNVQLPRVVRDVAGFDTLW